MQQPQAARDFYATQQDISQATAAEVHRLWQRMGDDFDASWRRVGPPIMASLIEGQRQAAKAAAEFIPRVLDETDLRDRPVADLKLTSLVGVASDGRDLGTLAYQGVVTAKSAIQDGIAASQALDQGGQWMRLMAALQVADTARVMIGVGVTARTDLHGYIRCLNPPVCQRCAVLGGRVYRWSTGFDRHPRDDCTMMPVKNAGWAKSEGFVLDPKQAYRDGQIKDLTEAQVKAIEDGADLGKVVNAYRGMSTTATERVIETIKPAVAPVGVQPGMPDLLGFLPDGVRKRTPVLTKPTPEGIYQAARGDRSKAIDLLSEWGYLT